MRRIKHEKDLIELVAEGEHLQLEFKEKLPFNHEHKKKVRELSRYEPVI